MPAVVALKLKRDAYAIAWLDGLDTELCWGACPAHAQCETTHSQFR